MYSLVRSIVPIWSVDLIFSAVPKYFLPSANPDHGDGSGLAKHFFSASQANEGGFECPEPTASNMQSGVGLSDCLGHRNGNFHRSFNRRHPPPFRMYRSVQ